MPGDQQRESAPKEQHNDGSSEQPTTTQWIVGIVATGLIAALVGFLMYHALTAPDGPPALIVRVERITEAAAGYVAELSVANLGGSTAAAVQVQGTLTLRAGFGREVVETSTATVSYVPAGAEREAGLFFTLDPRQYSLEVRATGYERP